MAMIRILMEEQRKNEEAREKARRIANLQRDEARMAEENRRETVRLKREAAKRAEYLIGS